MPIVRIDLRGGKPPAYRRALAEGVYRAMTEAADVPGGDRFETVVEHDADGLFYDPAYLGIRRDDDVVFVQITLNEGRSLDVKRALYARIVEILGEDPGVRPENVVISLVEVKRENWSFGNGIATYATRD